MRKRISLIIPVYNVEKYLRCCLDSCIHQDIPFDEYEIIIVNDGSPDSSYRIIDEYEKNFPNIKSVKKQNGGLSTARNAGLAIANGELIWFIDSDDSIKENCLSKIVSCFDDQSIEMITINYTLKDDNGAILPKEDRSLIGNNCYDGLEMFEKGWIYPFSAVQFYVFRRTYIDKNGLVFKEGIYGEDWLFTIISYTKFQTCLYLNEAFYNYYIHNGSITHNGTSFKKGHDCIEICNELHKVYEIVDDRRKIIINKAIAQTIKSIYDHWILNNKDVAGQIRAYALQSNFWLSAIVKSKAYKYIPLFLLLRLNIRLKVFYK